MCSLLLSRQAAPSIPAALFAAGSVSMRVFPLRLELPEHGNAKQSDEHRERERNTTTRLRPMFAERPTRLVCTSCEYSSTVVLYEDACRPIVFYSSERRARRFPSENATRVHTTGVGPACIPSTRLTDKVSE